MSIKSGTLQIAIHGRGAFRRFKDVLGRTPEELDRCSPSPKNTNEAEPGPGSPTPDTRPSPRPLPPSPRNPLPLPRRWIGLVLPSLHNVGSARVALSSPRAAQDSISHAAVFVTPPHCRSTVVPQPPTSAPPTPGSAPPPGGITSPTAEPRQLLSAEKIYCRSTPPPCAPGTPSAPAKAPAPT